MEASLNLAQLIERQTGGVDGNYPTAVDGLTLYRRSADPAPAAILYEPALCVIAQGSKRVTLASREFRYDATKYLLIAADVPAMAQIVGATARMPYLGLKLLLDLGDVSDLVAQMDTARQPVATARALAVGKLDAALIQSVCRLVDILDSPQDAVVLSPLLRREITYRLLIGPDGQRLRQVVARAGQAHRLTRALSWLKGHYTEPLRVEALAKQAGMSASALHHQFKAFTALSPLQYQKHLRLHEARRLMLAEALDAAEASFRVGYESPSQFSREYRRLFGEPPRRDIELLRGRATAGTHLTAGVSARKSPTRRPDPGPQLGALAEY